MGEVPKPLILYDKLVPEVEGEFVDKFDAMTLVLKEKISNCKYTMRDIFNGVVEEFNTKSYDKIISNQSDVTQILEYFLGSQISNKIYIAVALTWPPVIPYSTPFAKDFFYMLSQILQQVTDKEKFLKWSYTKLLPKVFSKRVSTNNDTLIAAGVMELKKKDVFVTLSTKHELAIYNQNDSSVELLSEDIVDGVTVEGENITFTKSGNSIKTLKPKVTGNVNQWSKVFGKSTQFIPFLNSGPGPYPIPYLSALYSTLTSFDLYGLRSVLISVSPEDECAPRLIESLLNVFINEGKANLLLESTLMQVLERPKMNIEKVLKVKSHFSNLVDIYVQRYGKVYFDKAVVKFIKYVEDKGDLAIEDPDGFRREEVEVMLYTIANYMMTRMQLIPKPLRHLCGVVRDLLPLKFNDRRAISRIIGEIFLKRIVLKGMNEPNTFSTEFQLKSGSSLPQFMKIANRAFVFEFAVDAYSHYEFIDKRLKKQFFRDLELFLFALGDNSEAKYTAADKVELAASLSDVAAAISKKHTEYTKAFVSLSEGLFGNTLGWNFAILIQSPFRKAFDNQHLKYLVPNQVEDEKQPKKRKKKREDGELPSLPSQLPNLELPPADVEFVLPSLTDVRADKPLPDIYFPLFSDPNATPEVTPAPPLPKTPEPQRKPAKMSKASKRGSKSAKSSPKPPPPPPPPQPMEAPPLDTSTFLDLPPIPAFNADPDPEEMQFPDFVPLAPLETNPQMIPQEGFEEDFDYADVDLAAFVNIRDDFGNLDPVQKARIKASAAKKGKKAVKPKKAVTIDEPPTILKKVAVSKSTGKKLTKKRMPKTVDEGGVKKKVAKKLVKARGKTTLDKTTAAAAIVAQANAAPEGTKSPASPKKVKKKLIKKKTPAKG